MQGGDSDHGISRRRFLQSTAAFGLLAGWPGLWHAGLRAAGGTQVVEVREGAPVDLIIAETPVSIAGREGRAITINGTLPGPLLRFREGETVTLNVTNRLREDSSIHWHGLLIPQDMDGVPGVSFPGILPGETFTYRFPLRQNGTYWYHSHSSLQEQRGHYAPMIIEPAGADPVGYDREHVILLSDWTFEDPDRVLAKLKKQGDYYNFQRRTLGDLFRDAARDGWGPTLRERAMWARMRMDPTDIADVTGYTYTYLVNGAAPQDNWTALFRPGERVRLRFINAAASTFFNVRIPGLPLSVVQADGQNVQPVEVDEFQIAVAETYDVIVEPREDRAYTVFAEAMDRSGYARGTLAPRPGMSAPVPALRARPLRSMVDMGMDMDEHAGMHGAGGHGMQENSGDHAAHATPMHGSGTSHGGMHADHASDAPAGGNGQAGMGHAGHADVHPDAANGGHPGMGEDYTGMPGMAQGMAQPGPVVARHGPDGHGPANAAVATVQRNRLGERGTGLADVPHRVLVYTDLRSLEPNADRRPPSREIELHLTGNMEMFIWGFDGKKFSEQDGPIPLEYGERVRVVLVNDTMMEHPMHLHGMFKEIDNGAGSHKPRKHTVSVKPAERLAFELTVDEPGNWAFHCHLLYHMEMGMMHTVNVPRPPGQSA